MMFGRRRYNVVLTVLFLCLSVTLAYGGKKPARRTSSGISCKAAIFSDSTRVKRLYGKNVHTKVLPASTTKVMTAVLVMEHLDLNQYVTVGSNPTRVQPSKIYVKTGERYKARDLLFAIMLNSANDASVVLAEAVAGSEANFVKMMNDKARAIGAKHTKFANSNGLPTAGGTQYTTAYDMYLIFRHALQYPFFRSVIKRKYATIYSSAGRKINLKSHNTVLFNNWKRKIYGKTGYTRRAQSCFVGTLEQDGNTLIIGVFGCTRRWDDVRNIVRKYGGISL